MEKGERKKTAKRSPRGKSQNHVLLSRLSPRNMFKIIDPLLNRSKKLNKGPLPEQLVVSDDLIHETSENLISEHLRTLKPTLDLTMSVKGNKVGSS